MKYLLRTLTKLISKMTPKFLKKKKKVIISENKNVLDESWEQFGDNISF